MRAICAVAFAFLYSGAIPTAMADQSSCEERLTETPKLEKTVAEAAHRFQKFFGDIKTQLFERDFFLETAKLALLAREHVLMLGPPGNAKSMGVDLIIDNIVDADSKETSNFKIQMTPETSLSETHGVIDYKKITEENIQTRKWEQGLLSAKLVFIDEFFDARANAIRNNLMALNEREHAQGRERIRGVTETGFAASNKYIHEVYEKAGDDGPKAIIDRFAFVSFVPGELAEVRSAIRLITEEGSKKLDKITFQDLDVLRSKLKEVVVPEYVARMLTLVFMRMKAQAEALEESEKKRFLDQKKAGLTPLPPYRSTKYYSARTLRKAGKILRAIVVNDWLEQGGDRPLVATSQDLDKLMSFFTLNSMSDEFLAQQEEIAVNPYEKIQIMTVVKERAMYREIYQAMMTEVNSKTAILTELEVERESAATEELKKKLVERMVSVLMENTAIHQPADSIRDLSEADVVSDYLRVTLESWLREIIGKDYDAVIEAKIAEVRKAREAKLAEERRLEREKREREVKEAREREARERREAAEREARQRRLKEKLTQFGEGGKIAVLATIPTSYRGTPILNVSQLPSGEFALLKVEGTSIVEEKWDFKTGKQVARAGLGVITEVGEQPQKITRFEDGNYLFWYGGYGRILNSTGLSKRKLIFEMNNHQMISDNSVDGEFWMWDWSQWNFHRLPLTSSESGGDVIKITELGFNGGMSGLAANQFHHDLSNHARLFLTKEKGVALVYGGHSDNQIRVYRVDLNAKSVEVVAAPDLNKGRHTRSKHRMQALGMSVGIPSETLAQFGDTLSNGKRPFHFQRYDPTTGKSAASRTVELPNQVHSALGGYNWDLSPDLSFLFVFEGNGFNLYSLETGEVQKVNLNGHEHGAQSVEFIDQDHILVRTGDHANIFRLPTAAP